MFDQGNETGDKGHSAMMQTRSYQVQVATLMQCSCIHGQADSSWSGSHSFHYGM
jgi:hypothetical protein